MDHSWIRTDVHGRIRGRLVDQGTGVRRDSAAVDEAGGVGGYRGAEEAKEHAGKSSHYITHNTALTLPLGIRNERPGRRRLHVPETPLDIRIARLPIPFPLALAISLTAIHVPLAIALPITLAGTRQARFSIAVPLALALADAVGCVCLGRGVGRGVPVKKSFGFAGSGFELRIDGMSCIS
jgi:hypothetical protein